LERRTSGELSIDPLRYGLHPSPATLREEMVGGCIEAVDVLLQEGAEVFRRQTLDLGQEAPKVGDQTLDRGPRVGEVGEAVCRRRGGRQGGVG